MTMAVKAETLKRSKLDLWQVSGTVNTDRGYIQKKIVVHGLKQAEFLMDRWDWISASTSMHIPTLKKVEVR